MGKENQSVIKYSRWVKNLGWAKIIAGSIGSVLLVLSIWGVITARDLGGVFCLVLAVVFLPSPLILVVGVGLVRLRPWARTIGLFVLPGSILAIGLFLLSYIILYQNNDLMGDPVFFATLALVGNVIIGFLFALPQVYILTRPGVKEQFK